VPFFLLISTTAELVDASNGAGPFTVFAPIDAAFAALPEETVASLILPENKEKLQSILTYHVVAGKVLSSDLSDGKLATTVNGDSNTISLEGDKVFINDAEVVIANILTDNGVNHLINKVIIPAVL
jgi:uncharacterized surface protein with fasciclin (FAS1) repeats